MTVTLTQHPPSAAERYREPFAALEATLAATGRDWLAPLRRAAFDRFLALGFPTPADEEWRFTNLGPLARTELRAAPAVALQPADLAPLAIPGLAADRIVFVNGRFAPALSDLGGLPRGVRVGSLAKLLAEEPRLLEPHLARLAPFQAAPLVAWNTAFLSDGAVVRIPRGVVLERPVHLLHVAVPDGTPFVTHPRHLLLLEAESQAAVLEEYAALGEGVYCTNTVTEAVVGEGVVLEHTLLQRESREAFNFSLFRPRQARNSSLASHSMLLGGGLVRREIHPGLAGEGAECLLNGLFLATGRQHMDNFMRVEHESPRCSSRQHFKGILDGRSRGVFHGRIVVHQDAQKTDAKQTNMNLLLSDQAQVDTKPQLEIYADDVKCTHGATIGQIDDQAIFYLRARGLSEAAARAMLLFAFAGEALDRMRVAPVRDHLQTLVTRWMPQGGRPGRG